MIKGNLELKFGTGDINIMTGHFIEDGKKIAYTGYRNQTPREIGTEGDDTSNIEKLNDMPILMTFYKTESIDVLIKALEEAKQLMIEEVEGECK